MKLLPFLLTGLLLPLTACTSQPEIAVDPDQAERLAAFFEEVFQAELDRDPDRAARLGFERPNDRWTDLSDEAALKQSETAQLMMSLPRFRQMRKSFANSSAVQTLIRQGI